MVADLLPLRVYGLRFTDNTQRLSKLIAPQPQLTVQRLTREFGDKPSRR